MSGDPSAMLVLGAAFMVFGGALAIFPDNRIIQTKDLGKRFGRVKENTRSLGIVFILLGLMLALMVLFVQR